MIPQILVLGALIIGVIVLFDILIIAFPSEPYPLSDRRQMNPIAAIGMLGMYVALTAAVDLFGGDVPSTDPSTGTTGTSSMTTAPPISGATGGMLFDSLAVLIAALQYSILALAVFILIVVCTNPRVSLTRELGNRIPIGSIPAITSSHRHDRGIATDHDHDRPTTADHNSDYNQ